METPMTGPTQAAKQRLDNALELIQRAQADLDRACAELSTLRGAITTWRATGKLSNKVKTLWYRVSSLRHSSKPLTVDSEPEAFR